MKKIFASVIATLSLAMGTTGTAVATGRTTTDATEVSAHGTERASIVPSPNRGAGNDVLNAISCTSASFCAAVGSFPAVMNYQPSGADRTLIEIWDGKKWVVMPSPNEGSTLVANGLDAVSCASPRFCVAVGSTDGTLVQFWNGTKWSVVPSPSPNSQSIYGSGYQLHGVSCPSANFCTAVGENNGGTLVEFWNGKRWSVAPSPNKVGYEEIVC